MFYGTQDRTADDKENHFETGMSFAFVRDDPKNWELQQRYSNNIKWSDPAHAQ